MQALDRVELALVSGGQQDENAHCGMFTCALQQSLVEQGRK